MKITIIGAGGVGAYFGAKLAEAGYDVSFVARGAQLVAMRENGLKIKSFQGDFEVRKFTVSGKISEIGQTDLIILGVKAWQIKEIRHELKPLMHRNTMVLPLQNGVLAADELQESVDKKNILGGLCRIISKIESPGVIHHLAVTPAIVFGELDQSNTERAQNIKTIFNTAGINTTISLDIRSDLWKKFISICVSGLLAVTRTTYGELRELPETRQMMLELLNEIYTVSQRIGVRIEPDFVSKTISLIDLLPDDATASLTRDVWEGKPSEIEYQNGTVVRLGEQYGVDTPVNRFVYNCILPMELKARK